MKTEFGVIIDYLVFTGACFAFSLLLNSLFLKFVKTLGIRDQKDTIIRWDSKSKPSIGGLIFYIIFLLSIIGYSFFFQESSYFLNKQFIAILIASTMGFLMGIFDDAYNTRPLIKFFTQVVCALILIYGDIYIKLFNEDIFNYAITIFWVVGMMNSINMLDNMDGITGIVSISVLLAALINLFFDNDYNNPHIFIILGLIAALAGFLRYNWNPSVIYMGDTGSQFLGAILSALGIMYFWNGDSTGGIEIQAKQIIIAITIFSIPIIDTTTVFYKRISRGKSPFIGGKDHTTHHMSYLGLSDRQVAYVYSGISLINITLTIIASNFITTWIVWHSLLFASYVLMLFIVLFYIANINTKQN